MKRKIWILLLIMMFTVWVGFGSQVFEVRAQTEVNTLTETKNHVLADVDAEIDLTTYSLQASFGTVLLSEGTLSSTNPALSITSSTVTISQKGVFPVQFSYLTHQVTLYFITKLASEDEYVIYQEDFNYPNGALPSGLSLFNNVGATGGSAAINNQRLMLSPSTIVLFPSYLQGFSNYIIETDMRMAQASNDSRWTSVMFRYTRENYYQMAIRQNAAAANGVEFAKRLEGSWNVSMTASFSEVLDPAKNYRVKLDVFETTVKEYINDDLLISYDGLFEYSNGRIGVQADNVTVYYDNVKITLPEDYIAEARHEFSQVADVYQPVSGVIAPASTIVWLNQASELASLTASIRPATVIFRVNSNLDVVDSSNAVIMPLYDLLIEIDGKVIPAFYTNDVETAEAVAEMMRNNRILDLFMVSASNDALLAARAIHSVIRGVRHFTLDDKESLTYADLMDIRKETNRAQAVASLLPGELLNRDLVEYMQIRVMTVWATATNDYPSQMKAVLSGANGIVSQNFEGLFDIYASFPANTHVRRPLMIAHRSLFNGGANAPENTIEAALESVARGADILEIDIHLTLDEEVIVLHDNNTARTAPAYESVTVASAFYHQLQAMHLYDPRDPENTSVKIPTLKEFMEAIKNEDIMIFIELKPQNTRLVELTKAIIEELDMYDQSAIIAFSQQNIRDFNTIYPEISNGWLNSSVLNATNLDASLTNMFSSIVPINATLNSNFGPLTQDFINAIVHRGLTVWPWTLNDFGMLNTYYNYGTHGITTDFFSHYDQTFNRLVMDNYFFTYTIDESSSFKVSAQLKTQTGMSYPLMPTLTLMDPDQLGITFDAQGNLSSTHLVAGSAFGYQTFASTLPDGKPIVLTSDLLTFRFIEAEPEIIDPIDDIDDPSTVSPTALVLLITGSTLALGGLGFLGFKLIKARKIV